MQLRIQTTIIPCLILFICGQLYSQTSELQTKLNNGELQMTFPSIYFKHNSTEYASMPYTVDSCFKFIIENIKVLNSYPLWKDSSETEQLANKRINKLRDDLDKHSSKAKITIKPVRNKQKIAQQTIAQGFDEQQTQYLLSLNSVLDVSGAIHPKKKWRRRTHVEGRYLCLGCWRRGAFRKEYQRIHGRKKRT